MANIEVKERKIGDGALSAGFRQGVKEIGEATKAFPDAISVQEPGGMYSPTSGEIADANRGGSIWDRVQDNRERAMMSPERDPPQKSMDRE